MATPQTGWNQNYATQWGRAYGLLNDQEQATEGLLVQRANSANMTSQLERAMAGMNTGGNINAYLPTTNAYRDNWTQDYATQWGRAYGLLNPSEIATGGLLTERAKAAGLSGVLDSTMYNVNMGANFNNLIPQTTAQQYVSNSIQNPQLPSNTQVIPQLLQNQQGETLQYNPVTGGYQIANQQINPNAGFVDPTTGQQYIRDANGQYVPVLIGNQTPQATAYQGTVRPEATVQGQLASLYSQTQDGQIPEWAQGAARAASAAMAARGLGASSIAAGAITESIQNSALDIAKQDAATYFNMDIQNLSNLQAVELENVRLRQQSMLSDQAVQNAALQFNATSQQEIDMFRASLASNIEIQNAATRVAIEQYNATNTLAVDQYNSQMDYTRSAFNATNQLMVDQSNVEWRRNINTANTAAINAANQINASNAFNLSTFALNAVWQQLRDESQWLWQSSENQAERDLHLALAAANFEYKTYLNKQEQDYNSNQELKNAAGRAVFNILGGLFD